MSFIVLVSQYSHTAQVGALYINVMQRTSPIFAEVANCVIVLALRWFVLRHTYLRTVLYVIVVVGMYSTSVLAELCWLALSLPSLWIYLTKVPDSLYERLKSGCTVASRWPESATRLTEEVLFTSLAGEDLSGAWAPRWTRAGCCPPCWTLPWVALRCLLMSWRRWLIVEVSINE